MVISKISQIFLENCQIKKPRQSFPLYDTLRTTVNWEIFVVKIFSDSMASAKKIICIINDNVVQGHLSENYLTRKFIAQNICDAKYS